jgi:hypothetical protein
MNEQTIKHLGFIQAVITRLAQNSFAYKGWSITLVAGIFALAVKEASLQYPLVLVALLPTVAFWGLDAYYLRQERLFRKLYDAIRAAPQADLEANPFTMNTSPYDTQVPSWWSTCWSKTIGWLYGPITLVILLVIGFAYAWYQAKGG